jgi:hypothetical protein
VAVDSKILAVASADPLDGLCNASTQVVDLAGGALPPGLMLRRTQQKGPRTEARGPFLLQPHAGPFGSLKRRRVGP